MEFREKRGARYAPDGYRAWFSHESRERAGVTVVCGHWSTQELLLAPNVLMLDSGCLWGGALTAIRLSGPPRLPGAVTPAGRAKAARIDASGGARQARVSALRRRESRPTPAIRRSTRGRLSPARRTAMNERSPTYAGAVDGAPAPSANRIATG